MKRIAYSRGACPQIPEQLEKNLRNYVVIGTAGLAVLCAPSANAAVKYTVAKELAPPNSTAAIDLNGDGVVDFAVGNFFDSSPGDVLDSVQAITEAGNAVAVGPNVGSAQGLGAGAEIGPALSFARAPIVIDMAFITRSSEGVGESGGQFLNKKNKFLGLKFVLNGETYYGWARVDTKSSGNTITAEVIDYAYQTTPNTPIYAGQGIKKTAGTLGALAVGSSAISSWRAGE